LRISKKITCDLLNYKMKKIKIKKVEKSLTLHIIIYIISLQLKVFKLMHYDFLILLIKE
jgi:hypothetical protein